MTHPVLAALLPVVILIAIGYIAGKREWMRAEAVKDLTRLVFIVFLPPLLFRTMATISPENLQVKPLLAYIIGMFICYGLTFIATGRGPGKGRRAAVLGLAASYSNTVMIGIALIGFAYGEQGQAVLLSLVAIHTLLMVTSATAILEFVSARDHLSGHDSPWRAVAQGVKNTLLQPMVWPILVGLAYGQTGWGIHPVIDKPISLLASAFSPLAVVLVGITLASTRVGEHLRMALSLSAMKNLLHPIIVAAAGLLLGLKGLPLVVMIVTASLPIGANVFLFAQRYETSQDEVTAAVAVSSTTALVTVALALWLAPMLA